MDIVATTSVIADPVEAIGGDHVNVIAVADPTICPHMQGEIIDSRIQMQKDFIASADLFFAHNSGMDKPVVMPAVEKFMQTNYGRKVNWTVISAQDWNTPEKAKVFAGEIKDKLVAADGANATAYEANYDAYCDAIDAADLTEEEKSRTEGQDVIVMVWQREAAENWLGLNVVAVFGPDFYMGGQFTPAKVVDDIAANPEKYRNVRYVIENMQSGEMAKGIEEALHDRGIGADRVIFTNFPKSLAGVDSLPDVLVHNKEAVTPTDRPMDIIATTSVIADPVQAIGGDHVNVIAVADPTICPHMQGEIIDSRIQMQKDFIASADLFFAHNSGMDKPVVMPAVEKFMQTNYGRNVAWTIISTQDWNTPEKAKVFAGEVKEILMAAQPWNADAFETNFQAYCDAIDEADIADRERSRIEGQDVIVMVWQKEAAENWLGLNVVAVFGPDFYMGGQFTPAKVVDDIAANPEKYRNVKYVIENMQSGEMAKGVEEALHDRGIEADRVIFTNFPKSLPGVDSLPGVLAHNKEAVMASPVTPPAGDSGSEPWETALATDITTGEESEFCFEDCAITRVVIVPEEDMSSLTMTAQELPYPPYETGETGNATYQYLEVGPGFGNLENCNVTFEFSVDEAWIEGQGINTTDIALQRYHDGAWQTLRTEYLGTEGGVAKYRAYCTGFSFFAITVVQGWAVAAVAEEIPVQTTVTTAVTTAAATPPETTATTAMPTTPETTTTTVPPTTAQQSPVSFIPFLTAAALAVLLLRRT
ncbi:metal ABC transporter solute-binding protein, Zn/Mn family [Methanofollis sp. UBA420]|uniref:metal ABC transporter solute-binding protein, Zn/Mn family n=1 Tax=Methanofollis sp. UBA420 TaxID=1915514 RepID=UPI00316AD8C1